MNFVSKAERAVNYVNHDSVFMLRLAMMTQDDYSDYPLSGRITEAEHNELQCKLQKVIDAILDLTELAGKLHTKFYSDSDDQKPVVPCIN